MPEPKIKWSSVILHAKLTEVTFSVLPESSVNHGTYAVTVAYRGDELYAVLHRGFCLAADGTWDYEPRPSSREDDWLATHRFDYDTASQLAREHAPKVIVNGRTAAQQADLEAGSSGVAVKP